MALVTNAQVRKWYLAEVRKITDANSRWVRAGIALSERARRCHALRHQARLRARQMMSNPAEVRLLEARDRALYGDSNGPTFEQLMQRYRQAGLSEAESLEAIIEGSQRTSRLSSFSSGAPVKRNL